VSKTEFNDELQPAWSPDSQYILFVSVYQGKSEIYMIDGSARLSRVTNNQFDDNAPDWGPIK
jgi:Tol biopolymer transport system component